MTFNIETCRFMYGKSVAYSMTYDEGFIEVLANAYPIHKQYDIPGHLDVVTSQLGQRRNCYRSSMNGHFHMGVEHLKFLISQDWSVGNHSYSHFHWPTQPGLDLYREIVKSKHDLEDALGVPITFFAIPNDKFNYEPALPYIKKAGYLGCQYVDGGVNHDDVDLLKIGNYVVASGEHRPGYDWPDNLKTKNMTFAYLDGGWLCETTHLVLWNTPQPRKNVTPEHLDQRFAKVTEICGDRLWAATPEDVIDYILLRRNVTATMCETQDNAIEFEITGEDVVGVVKPYLTFRVISAGRLKDHKVTQARGDSKALPEVIDVRIDGDDLLVTCVARVGLCVRIETSSAEL